MLEWVQNQANRARIDNPIRRRQTMGDRIVGNDHVAITGRETGIKVTIDQVWEERRGEDMGGQQVSRMFVVVTEAERRRAV